MVNKKITVAVDFYYKKSTPPPPPTGRIISCFIIFVQSHPWAIDCISLPSGILLRAAVAGIWIVFVFLRVTNITVAVILLCIKPLGDQTKRFGVLWIQPDSEIPFVLSSFLFLLDMKKTWRLMIGPV